jgi:putative Holliday junction resolvase
VKRLARLVTDMDVVEVVVGLPRTLAERTGPSAVDAIAVADALAARIAPIPVRLADERLTTVTAQRELREAGIKAKGQRAMIDQAAAVGILQTWLDQRRAVAADGAGAADA